MKTISWLSPKAPFDPQQKMAEGIVLENVKINHFGEQFAPFKTSRFSIEPGCSSGCDQHVVRELWIIGEGQGVLTYDGLDMEVKKNEFLFFDTNKSHSILNTGPKPLHIFSIWWPA